MRILPLLLLLCTGSSSASIFYSATAHHNEITNGIKLERAQELLFHEFRLIFDSAISSVQITHARSSSLDSSSVLMDIVITLSSELSRDSILESLEDTPIRLLRLSQAHSSPPSPRSIIPTISILDSSSSTPTPCSGHGVLLPNATCVCDNFWNGDECDQLNCFGGVARDGRCACPPGRFAEHCQPQTCMPPMNDNLSLKKRSIVIALNLRNTMARDLQYIIPDLGSTLEELVNANKNTYDHFVLYSYLTFGNTTVDDIFETDDYTSFWRAMQEVAISKGEDRQPTLGALRKAINASPLIHPRSLVFLFADSYPSDSSDWSPTETDQTEEVQLIEQILAYGHRLVITLTDQPNLPLDPENQDFESLDRVASTVHGDLIHTSKTAVATTTQYFTPLMHQSENVFIKTRFTCGQETDTTVEIDDGISQYYVAFSGTEKVQLFAQLSDGSETQVDAVVTVPNFVVFKVDSSRSFIRVVTPTSTAPFCSFRVFVQSSDNILVSFAHDSSIDVGSATATQGSTQHLTVFSSQPTLSHKAQMRDLSGNNLGTNKELSTRTATCSFTLEADSDATCMAGPIHMKISASDAAGKRLFTRVVPAMCEKPAVRDPAPWTCLYGGTVIDNSQGGQSCLCPRLFDGAHCESPQCHNGASRNQFPVDGEPLCLCQIGWDGRHCETLADCPQPVDADFSIENRQFVLVLQVSFSQNFIFDDVISALGKITTNYASYVLVTYNQALLNGVASDNIARYEFSSVDGMIDQLNKVKYTYAASDKQPIARAIMEALGNKTNRNDAIVFVLTDTDDSSADSVVVEMKKSTTQTGAPLHIIRTQQFGDSCTLFDDKKISNFARETGGVYLNTCADGSSNDEISQAISSLASHPSSTQLVDVEQHFYEDCSGITFPLPYRANGADGLFVRIVSESTLDSDVTAVRLIDQADLNPTKTLSMNTIHEWTLPIDMGDLGIDRFSANVTVSSGGGCAVFVFTDSPDSLWYSYGAMESDTVDRNAFYGVATFPRVHIQGAEQSNLSPGADFYVYDLTGKQTYGSSAGELRGNCSYELLYPNEMACPTHDGGYIVTASVSHLGYIVQRTWFAYCGMQYGSICGVHGSYYSSENKCYCSSGWGGDYCEVPDCVNGKADNGVCACEKKFIGDFCEYAMCDSPDFWTAGDERAREFRSVTFVMELTNNAITANIMFQAGIADVVNSIDSNPKQFNLITYDDEVVTFAASSSVAINFISEFNRIISPPNHKQTTPSTTKAFTAIDQAMQLNVAQPNLIIAFVSASSTAAKDEFNRIINQHPGVQVNIIYTPVTVDVMLPTTNPYYLYEGAAYISGGRVIPSTQINAYYLPEVIKSLVTEDVLLTVEGASDCTGGYTSTFQVESSGYRLVVLVMGTGVDASKVILSRNEEVMDYSIRRDLFSDSATYSFEIPNLWSYPGAVWTVKATTTKGRCVVQAHVQANLRTEIGFVTDPHDDFVRDLPFSGNADKDNKATRFALSVAADAAQSVTFTKASLFDFDLTTGKRTPKGEVAIGLRDYGGVSRVNYGCAYQYISEPFTLTSYMAIVAQGYDKHIAENIQRTFIVSSQAQPCNGGQYQPTGECICPEGFAGDDCFTSLCANGGSASGSICICTSGYTGPHCEEILSPTITTTTKTTTIATTTAAAQPTSDLPSEATDATVTTAGTTASVPTTTKTIPVCYADATTYNIAMFIENSNFNFPTPTAANKILISMAAQYRLGEDPTRSKTEFMLNGVNKEYFYAGRQQSVEGINDAIDNIDNSLEFDTSNLFNLGGSLTSFKQDHMAEFTATKPFALVFTGITSSDDATLAVQDLKNSDYSFIGIALTDAAENYLLTLTDDVYRYKNDVDEAAEYVRNVTCGIKPR